MGEGQSGLDTRGGNADKVEDKRHKISYAATDYALSDRQLYPHFFRMLQNDRLYYKIIAQLMKRYGWTWVGILTMDSDSGETETLALTKYLTSYGICIAFTLKFNSYSASSAENFEKAKITVQQSTAEIIIMCGAFNYIILHMLERQKAIYYGKTLILPPSWTSNDHLTFYYIEVLNGTLTVDLIPLQFPADKDFFYKITPSKRPKDKILEDLWIVGFRCLSENVAKNKFYESSYKFTLSNCTGKEYFLIESVDDMYGGTVPRTYYAVKAMASALHEMHVHLEGQPDETTINSHNYRQLHPYLKNLKNILEVNRTLLFDEKGEVGLPYLIDNWYQFPNFSSNINQLGTFTEWAPEDQQLKVTSDYLITRNLESKFPRSQCSDNCLPGYRKVVRPGTQACCYDCAQCPVGEISNRFDSENCIKCSYIEWPNEKKDQCIPRIEEYLSYNNDVIVVVFAFSSVILFLITAGILVIFILFKDTPIVKANNKSLSFVLLGSIMLSFPCVFLFLGRPVDITCMLRQTSFSVIFSTGVSCILGKTVMIYIVFKATKPGSAWGKWVNMKMANFIVVIFSSVQILINISWLIISLPFQELDTQSYPGKIIIQCNEGSVIAFYSVLGYMGFLAAVSFFIAFLARTLPDSFNEAKYITFSMLVFCSVWIAMIPAYLSTRGKDMVSVEIFAILTSSAGLLVCIFFPKCYIILLRPEMNTKAYLLSNNKQSVHITA
ncbi:vomeronasal type-2 receptor 26-like [Pelodytes ibericus]